MSKDLLLGYYGDDLTGSTDVMESMALGGVPTVLFMRVPDADLQERFSHCRALGIAGTSRSETPEWMDEHLPPAFAWMKGLGAAICHYKVCSTFDSSPTVGNIGRAIEIGKRLFEQDFVPVVVGAPQLRRYTSFGNLFAGYQGQVYRIDRHPVMCKHPVTPMHEADLLLHLAKQTSLRSRLLDGPTLRSDNRAKAVDRVVESKPEILLMDVDSIETQRAAGQELWRLRRPGGFYVAGSSGVEYALMGEWVRTGVAPGKASFDPTPPVDRIATVSGSVSPTTERQIRHALAHGFDGIALDARMMIGEGSQAALDKAVAAGLGSLKEGRSVILYTALGSSADLGAEIDKHAGARHLIGRSLGRILNRLVVEQSLKRAVIAGGDTSSHALGQLGVDALTVRMPFPQSPGSPLCVAHSRAAGIDGLEIALKGGQVGTDAYFVDIRDGVAA